MSAYANDPRVTRGNGIVEPEFQVVTEDGQPHSVANHGVHGWLIGDAEGRVLEFSPRSFDTADEAIRSLIGDPQ